MDSVLKLIFIIFIGFFILIPVYIQFYKESIWKYIRERIKEDAKYQQIFESVKQENIKNHGKKNK